MRRFGTNVRTDDSPEEIKCRGETDTSTPEVVTVARTLFTAEQQYRTMIHPIGIRTEIERMTEK